MTPIKKKNEKRRKREKEKKKISTYHTTGRHGIGGDLATGNAAADVKRE